MPTALSFDRVLRAFAGTALVTVLLTASLTASLIACGSTEPKVPDKDVVPTSITATTTGTLTGIAGLQLATPLTVVVTNKTGQPIDSAIVTFAVTSGGGSLGGTSVRTNAQGQASTTWTLGSTVGAQTVTATVGSLPAVTFTASATAAAAAALTKVAGTDAQTAAAGATVTNAPAVRVADAFGNPVANVLVTFAVAGGGGTLTGAAANSGADGIARVGSWRLGPTAGANSVTATATGVPPVTFTATGTAGAVARIQITNTAPLLTAGQTFQLVSKAFDANNNEVVNTAIVYSTSNAAVATVNATNGTVTAVGAGTATITATFGTVTATQVVSVIGHPAGTLVANVPAGSRIGGVAIAGTTTWIARSSTTFAARLDLAGVTNATVPTDVQLDHRAVDVGVSASGQTVVAATASAMNLLWFINPTTMLKTDSVELPAAPVKLSLTSTGSRVFVAQNNFNVSVVDVASRTVTSQIAAPGTVIAMRMSGDTLLYIGTALGRIYQINVATGTIRSNIETGVTLVDFDISRDGKTLFFTDGGTTVTMRSLATGGLSGSVDYGASVKGVAIAPDGLELWASVPGKVIAAEFQGGTFVTINFSKQYTIAGASPARIFFSRVGDFAVITDDSANTLIILR